MASVGDLVVNLAANTRGFTAGITSAGNKLRTFAGNATTHLAKVAAAATATATAFTAIKGIQLAADAESMAVRMKTMLGNATKAKRLLAEIGKFAAATPFQKTELNEAAASLIGFGFVGEDTMRMMKTLGDVAAGTQRPIADFVDIIGKSKFGVQMAEINRLIDRQVPIYSALSTVMGKTEGEIRNLVSTGKVSFAQLRKAIERTTESGGMYHDAMKAQSTTILGKWSTLKDNMAVVATGIGEAILDAFDMSGALENTTTFTQQFEEEWLPAIKELIFNLAEMTTVIVKFGKEAAHAFNSATNALKRFGTASQNWIGTTLLGPNFKAQDLQADISGAPDIAPIDTLKPLGFSSVEEYVDAGGEENAEERHKRLLTRGDKILADLAQQARANKASRNAQEQFAELKRMAENAGTAIGTVMNELAPEGFAERGRQITDMVKTDAERLKETLAELRTLRNKGFIDTETAVRAARQAREQFAPQDNSPARLAGALERGSAEAMRAIQNAIAGGSNDPQKRTEKNTAKTAKTAERIADGIEQMADAFGASAPVTVVSFNGA